MRRVVFIISLLCAGCAGTPTQPGQLGQPFELRAGTSATLEEGLAVIFDRVDSDSRCAIDAVCVSAGDAVIAVTISQGAAGSGRRELHTEPRDPKRRISPTRSSSSSFSRTHKRAAREVPRSTWRRSPSRDDNRGTVEQAGIPGQPSRIDTVLHARECREPPASA